MGDRFSLSENAYLTTAMFEEIRMRPSSQPHCREVHHEQEGSVLPRRLSCMR
jgi:hypothetical protein